MEHETVAKVMAAAQGTESPDDLMLTPEVALRVRAPEATLRYWRHRGEGPRSFKVGRRVVYVRAEVERWLAEQAKGA
jgi:predicted DNA-binding transcriptional regulator AlpA